MDFCFFKGQKIVLFLFIIFTTFNTVQADDQSSFINSCKACHTEDKHKRIGFISMSQACTTCHNTPKVDELKRDPIPIQDKDKVVAVHNPKHPMYYSGTHIGINPNELVFVPTGEFIMGTNDRLPDESPAHKVILPAFWIDKYEVTNAQYKSFIDDTHRKSPALFQNRTYPEGKADHPVTFVTWIDADAYCQWANKRLPTDQEWEKAARSNDGRIYPWGNHFDPSFSNSPQHWLSLNQEGDTTPVGFFEKGISPYGAYDMSGNVWEWTTSWYQAYPGNTRQTENYGEIYKTLKGGSWWDCSFYKCGMSAPAFNRAFFLKTTKNKSFGFRCAKDAH